MLAYLSLLLAVTTAVQATPPPPARPHRRAPAAPVIPVTPVVPATPVVPIAPLTAAAAELEALSLQMAQPDFAMFSTQAPVLAMSAQALQGPVYALSAAPMVLSAQLAGLSELAGLSSLAPLAALADAGDFTIDEEDEPLPEVRWPQDEASTQGDVADSAYRAARQALNRNDYQKAAELFRGIRERYPKSTYVPNTYYWEAFALYRTGSDDNLRTARTALETQANQYPKATTRRDAAVLLRRVQGELARRGDQPAATAIAQDVDELTSPRATAAADRAARAEARAQSRAARAARPSDDRNCDDDDDIRIAALNAVLQMDPDRAVPLLKTVLARRDEGSACLRRKAVFLVSQKRTDETSRILLDAVRSDPDQEVQEQAVFWLSQVPGDETVAALDSILRGSKDSDIQEKAIFALSQHHSARAAATLRDFAARRDANSDLREKAIFWIGQTRSPDNAQFLKDLYAKVENDDLKEKIIFSLSQMGGADNYRWLMDIALNPKEDIEIRKKALFWAGQGHNVDVADLVKLYDSMNDREMREQLIFVYSQRREDAALDKLFQIGKSDPDRELRKKAIFWIGQSRSPRAAQYLQELINQ